MPEYFDFKFYWVFSRLAEILCYFWFTYISELDKVTTINLFDIKYVSWKNWLVEWTSKFFPRHCIHILDIPHNWPPKSLYRSPAGSKKIVERRHGEPIKFLFLSKMGPLGSRAGTEKKLVVNSEQLLRAVFFHVLMGKKCNFQFFLRVCIKKLLYTKVIYFF